MSDFFANLIDRHQGRVETVAPRAHSYFEEEPNPGTSGVGDLSQTSAPLEPDQPFMANPVSGAALPEEQDKSAVDTNGHLASAQRLPVAAADTHVSRPARQVSTDPLQALSPGRQLVRPEPEAERNTHQGDSLPGSEHANEAVHRSESTTPPVSASTLDMNERINAVLKRLQGQLKTQSVYESTHTRPGDLQHRQDELGGAGVNTDITPGPVQDGLEPSAGADHAGTSDQSFEAAETDSQINLNRGELELPAWLSRRQAEFNLRNTETNQNPEPVVNVSIGRVEVRAVRESKPRSGSSRTKPSGVMSLDEYLSKRQRKGVV